MVKKIKFIILSIIVILTLSLYFTYLIINNKFVITPSNIGDKEIFLQEKGHYFYVINNGEKEIIEVIKNQNLCVVHNYIKSDFRTIALSIEYPLMDFRSIKYILFLSPKGKVKVQEIKGNPTKMEWIDDTKLKVNLLSGKEKELKDPFHSSIFEKLIEKIKSFY